MICKWCPGLGPKTLCHIQLYRSNCTASSFLTDQSTKKFEAHNSNSRDLQLVSPLFSPKTTKPSNPNRKKSNWEQNITFIMRPRAPLLQLRSLPASPSLSLQFFPLWSWLLSISAVAETKGEGQGTSGSYLRWVGEKIFASLQPPPPPNKHTTATHVVVVDIILLFLTIIPRSP